MSLDFLMVGANLYINKVIFCYGRKVKVMKYNTNTFLRFCSLDFSPKLSSLRQKTVFLFFIFIHSNVSLIKRQ